MAAAADASEQPQAEGQPATNGSSSSMDSSEAPPNHTLYVNNLNEKVKLDELKKSLYHVFSQYGAILEIHASKTLKLKGQAWIVFDELSSATKALKAMANFTFYGKPMKVSFAKAKSDAVAKLDGTFVKRPKRKLDAADGKDEGKETKSNEAKEEKEKETATAGGPKAKKTKKAAGKATTKPEQPRKKKEPATGSASAAVSASQPWLQASVDAVLAPNKILFVENLPVAFNSLMLAMLFDKYMGYKEARMVPGKPGIAFVEFADAFQASVAKDGLQGFKITPTVQMKITFAKQ